MKEELTYKNSGVDIDLANETKQELAKYLSSNDKRILNQIGPYASLFEANFTGIKEPVLVLKAEEPGSKQLLAIKYKRITGIGFDLINHLINDIIVMGAEPLAVLDTIIYGKLEKEVVVELVKSIAQACHEQGCSLVGGELSEQPGVLAPRTYVLCASILGVVDKSKIIDGSRIEEGDYLLALPSNGLHSNGYSLVRKIIEMNENILNEKIGSELFLDVLMRSHKCYKQSLQGLFDIPELHGLAHITGGGIARHINRILPKTLSAVIDLSKLEILPIFSLIHKLGNVPEPDMIRTFNMGVGMIIVVHPAAVNKMMEHLSKQGEHSFIIGKITGINKPLEFSGKLKWQFKKP